MVPPNSLACNSNFHPPTAKAKLSVIASSKSDEKRE